MIAFLKHFQAKALLLCLNILTLIGACMFRTLQNASSNSLDIRLLMLLRPYLRQYKNIQD